MDTYLDLYTFDTATGIVVPQTSKIQEHIEQVFQNIFGADLDMSPETPVGRLIEAFTVILKTTLGVTAQNANQFNLNYATGIYLDALAQLFGLERVKATYTDTPICVKGTADGFTVPKGALIKNERTKEIFEVVNAIEVPPLVGVGYGTARALNAGAVDVRTGDLTRIVTNVLGWRSVTNGENYHIGKNEETDEEFRARVLSARVTGSGFIGSIRSRIATLVGVHSVNLVENNKPIEILNKGVTIPSHSLFICVDGGDEDEIFEAIRDTKSVGAGFKEDDMKDLDGNSTLVRRDFYEFNYVISMAFYRPVKRPIYVRLSADKTQYEGIDAEQIVKQALLDYIAQLPIAESIYANKLAVAITSSCPALAVGTITVSRTGGSDSWKTRVDILGNEKAILRVQDISIEWI